MISWYALWLKQEKLRKIKKNFPMQAKWKKRYENSEVNYI